MIITSRLNQAQRTYLDLLRAAAAFSVLLGHGAIFFLQDGFLRKSHIDTCGVMVFFLLSGFLISLSVFQKHADQAYGFREFFIDRFCRIFVGYIPALLFVALVDYSIADLPLYREPSSINAGNHYDVATWAGNLFMMQDYPLYQIARRLGVPDNRWFVTTFGSAGSFWTISIEWWIYMVFGMAVYYRLRGRRAFSPWQWLLFLFMAVEPFYHFVGGLDRCLTMLWGLGMGASLFFLHLPRFAMSWRFEPVQWKRFWLLVCVVSLATLLAHVAANLYHLHEANIAEFQFGTLLASVVFSFLLAMSYAAAPSRLFDRLVGFFASYSYSLYLTHPTLLWYLYIRYPNHEHDLAFFWYAMALCNVVAIVFWWLFERHYRDAAAKLKALGRRNAGLSS